MTWQRTWDVGLCWNTSRHRQIDKTLERHLTVVWLQSLVCLPTSPPPCPILHAHLAALHSSLAKPVLSLNWLQRDCWLSVDDDVCVCSIQLYRRTLDSPHPPPNPHTRTLWSLIALFLPLSSWMMMIYYQPCNYSVLLQYCILPHAFVSDLVNRQCLGSLCVGVCVMNMQHWVSVIKPLVRLRGVSEWLLFTGKAITHTDTNTLTHAQTHGLLLSCIIRKWLNVTVW